MTKMVGLTTKQFLTVKQILSEYPYIDFYLYGSRINGNFSRNSDLDVLAKGNSKLSFNLVDELKDKLINTFKLDNEKISFYKYNDVINKIIIIPGSGSSDIDFVIDEKPDILITSDIKHNHILDLKDSNISYFNATHYGLENIFINCFYNYLKELDSLKNINILKFDIKL